MPFLRVIRDKRGYETTYLMHWYREGSRQHSRILYVFRSPGGVRVGRDPLEPEIQRHLERQHPEISFDWKVVRENQQVIEAAPEPRRRRAPRDEAAALPAPVRPAEAPAPPSRPPIPSKIEGDTPDTQIAFLSAQYPVIRERIRERVSDPARQEVLLTLCERLNPAAWTDADQITTGLQEAGEALDRLAHVFARRRRRSRKKGRAGSDDMPAAGGLDAVTEAPGNEEDGDGSSDAIDPEESSSV